MKANVAKTVTLVLNNKNVSVIRHMKLSRLRLYSRYGIRSLVKVCSQTSYYSVSVVLIPIQFKLWTSVMTELCDQF